MTLKIPEMGTKVTHGVTAASEKLHTPPPKEVMQTPHINANESSNDFLGGLTIVGIPIGGLIIAMTMYFGGGGWQYTQPTNPNTGLVGQTERFCKEQADEFVRKHPDIKDGYKKALEVCKANPKADLLKAVR